ncbi:hypothetical protein D3C73_1417590 [compost metagenome]
MFWLPANKTKGLPANVFCPLISTDEILPPLLLRVINKFSFSKTVLDSGPVIAVPKGPFSAKESTAGLTTAVFVVSFSTGETPAFFRESWRSISLAFFTSASFGFKK